jgi:hypothetical protein
MAMEVRINLLGKKFRVSTFWLEHVLLGRNAGLHTCSQSKELRVVVWVWLWVELVLAVMLLLDSPRPLLLVVRYTFKSLTTSGSTIPTCSLISLASPLPLRLTLLSVLLYSLLLVVLLVLVAVWVLDLPFYLLLSVRGPITPTFPVNNLYSSSDHQLLQRPVSILPPRPQLLPVASELEELE